MGDKFTVLDSDLHRYIVERGARQDELLARVERDTDAMGSIAQMQVAADQGALLTLLTRLVNARLAVEVGTFTGYSAICIARGLAEGGRLICCELEASYAQTALGYLGEAGLNEAVDMRVGPALETLRALSTEEKVDLAFIDADKESYPRYYEELLARLRPGGLLLLDNVLLGGRVTDPPPDEGSAQAMAQLNDAIAGDERVDVAMIGVADGITLVRRR